MQTLFYISDPDIASQHLQDYLIELFRPSQWAVIYPSFDQPASDAANFEEFKKIIEDEYEEYLLGVHRPDDDFPDLSQAEEDEIVAHMEDEDGCQEWRKGNCSCDECSELCPEKDTRFDTIHKREAFYTE